MKELQNFVYRHMDALKHHKRYLAMLTALSMLVTFIVPLILMEPADSMSGILICGKTEHIHDDGCYEGDTPICGQEYHVHSGACYLKYSSALKGAGNDETGNINIPNAGGGYDEDTGTYTPANDHPTYGVSNNVVGKDDQFYNPASLPLYTLLFGEPMDGETHWVDTNATLEGNLQIVNQEYFLGYASDFCAFIESDFIATDADAEGRVFIGGDLIFKGGPAGEWNYQVGAGDYGQFKPIWNTDEYGHLVGFASGIIGGKVYRLGTMTTGAISSFEEFATPSPNGKLARHYAKYDVLLYPEEGAYKRFIVGNLEDSLHLDEDYLTRGVSKDIPYGTGCNHLYYYDESYKANNEESYCPICKEQGENLYAYESDHSYLGHVNELSQFYLYDGVNTILEKTFDTMRARSMSLASVDAIKVKADNGTLNLDATNIGDAKTVYFEVEDWEKVNTVNIFVPRDRVKEIKESQYSKGAKTITELDLNIIVSCDDTEITINGTGTTVKVPKEDGNGYDDYKISNDGANKTNNHPVSSNILYNFYNAKNVTFSDQCNFNGTIYAPNADVKSPEKCPGHLSGALVAKSFYGGLEFGYRPYRGGVDIFGMVSGYAVPVNKVDQNEDTLPGALFAIKEDSKVVSLFESGNGTNFASLPSRVDFSGNGPYKADEVKQEEVEREYTGSAETGEKLTAPVDFTLYSDSSCNNQITINEGKFNIGNSVKFYLKPDQNVNIVENENFKYKKLDSGVYEIYLIKPVNGSFDITVQNAADISSTKTVTINANQEMTLNVRSECNVGESITLTPTNPPIGENVTIYYKYFVNGNLVTNDTCIQDGYTTSASFEYPTTVPGSLILGVRAYVNIDGLYYEVAKAEDQKTTVKTDDTTLDGVGISITNSSNQVVDAITSGESFKIQLSGLPEGANVEYYRFYGSDVDPNNVSTSNIAGKDLLVTAKVSYKKLDENGQTITLEKELLETITVNFNNNEGMYFDGYEQWYNVGEHTYDFKLNNADYYKDSTITYYFKDQPISGSSITPTIVGSDIPVYAKISVNGLEKQIDGSKVNGKYNDGLGINIAQSAFVAGSPIKVELNHAPNNATVVFRAYDSNGNEAWTQTVTESSNGTYSATYPSPAAGNYTFKATMYYAGNPEKEIQYGQTITVAPKTINGEFTVNPIQISTGDEVEFAVSGATDGSNVAFEIYDKDGNRVTTLYETVNNGGCSTKYQINQAGNYTVNAIISNSDGQKTITRTFDVKENTAAFTGSLTYELLDNNTRLLIKVASNAEGGAVKFTINGPNWNQPFTQGGNINNGVFEYNFYIPETNGSRDGGYTISGTVEKNGQTKDLNIETFTIGTGASGINGEISFSKGDTGYDDYVAKKPINVKFSTNAADNKNVNFKIFYYETHADTKNATVYNGVCSVEFEPLWKGDYTVKAEIDGIIVAEQKVRVNGIFKFNQATYEPGGKVEITVEGVDGESIAEVQEFTIEGQAVNPYDVKDNTLTFDLLSQYVGDFKLYLRIKLSAGAVIEWNTTIKIVSSTTSSNTEATTTTTTTVVNAQGINNYSFRRFLSILADESTDPAAKDNEIVISVEGEDKIKSVRLILPSDTNTGFTLKAIFNGDENCTEQYNSYAEENGIKYIDVTTSKISEIKSIKIIPVAGAVTVDKYYPTYVKTVYKITKTPSTGFTLNAKEEKEIILEDWAQSLDSVTLDLSEDGIINYALVRKGQTTLPEFSEGKSENKKVIIQNTNAEEIEKIKIYTKDKTLTVNQYSISAFVDSEYSDLELLKDNDFEITNYYTLVEQQPLVGYFKEDTVYTIEVQEIVKLNELYKDETNQKVYPKVVFTTITVRDKNGIEKMKYTVESHPRDDTGYNANERKLIVHNSDGSTTTFYLSKNGDNNVTVSSDSTSVTSSSSPIKFEYGDKDYYLDPAAMMIVPVDNPIVYTNTKGLLFRKVDNNGAIVQDALIELQKKVGDNFVNVNGVIKDGNVITEPDENLGGYWNWSKGSTSEFLLPMDKLVSDVIYRFHEADVNDKYELAKDIYFEKISDDKIQYWEEEGDKKTLDISSDNIIYMSDYKKPGIELKLGKVDEKGEALAGAEFALYAENGTDEGVLIKEGINVGDGTGFEVDLTQGIQDGAEIYVKDGYLKPGNYFLKETKIPKYPNDNTKWFADPGKIGFVVHDNRTIEYVGKMSTANAPSGWGPNEYWLIYNGKSMKEGDLGAEIKNVSNLYVVLSPQPGKNITINECWTNNNPISNAAITTTSNPVKFEKSGDNYILNWDMKDSPKTFTQFKIRGYEIVYSYVEITTSDGEKITYKDPSYTVEGEEDEIPVFSVNDDKTIIVGNHIGENSRDVKVKKEWLNCEGFENYQPPVEVTLYQSKTEITDLSNLTDEMIYRKADGKPYTIQISSDSSWSASFKDVPVKYQDPANGEFKDYYYYVKETPLEGYTTAYDIEADGTLVVQNTPETIKLSVKKYWEDGNGSTANPENIESITLQLQINNNNNGSGPSLPQWVNVTGRTLTLSAYGNWQGEFTGLIKGKSYRVIEAPVDGWKVDGKSYGIIEVKNDGTKVESLGNADGAIDITNIPESVRENGNLIIQKLWNTTEGLPESVYFKLYRKEFIPAYPLNQPAKSILGDDGKIATVGVQDDYARLLQYSLYFYDANMCGDKVDENSAYTWRSDCHTSDGEFTGGFHDAGDHVMFGLPQGYSASMLGWGLYEFPDSFKDLGLTSHMKTLEDYYCDFFMKCAKYDNDGNITAILYQKGDGDTDHRYWGIPEEQDNVQGGRNNQLYWTDDAEAGGSKVGGDIAAEYAAALALAYLNNMETYNSNDSKYNDYLEMAKKLYAFAESHTEPVTGRTHEPNGGGFYQSSGSEDDRKWAAVWLHLATQNENGESQYKQRASEANFGGLNISWNDVQSAAAIAYAAHVDSSKQEGIKNSINNNDKNVVKDGVANDWYLFGGDSGGWGQMRHNAAYQTSVLVANKFAHGGEKSQWTEWCKNQMNVILGDNDVSGNDPNHPRESTCFVTNFAENSLNHPHYRATSGIAIQMEMANDPAVINGYDLDRNQLIGGLAGGWYDKDNPQNFRDERLNYKETEVATDYNAGLVIAAAGLYSVYGTGEIYNNIPGVKATSNGAQAMFSFGPQRVTMQKPTVNVLSNEPIVIAGSDVPYEVTFSSISNVSRIEIEFEGTNQHSGYCSFASNEYYGINYQTNDLSNNIFTISSGIPNSISFIRIGNHYTQEGQSLKVKEVRIYTGTNTTTPPTLTIDKISINLSNNETATLTVNPNNNPTFTYDQNNLQIDSLGNGNYKVTGKSAGNYTISATVNGVTSNEVTLTVTQQQAQTPTLTIDKTSINLSNNETANLTVNPSNATLSYEQNNLQIDALGNGNYKITGKTTGKHTITATLNGQTASVDITVTENSSSGGNTDTSSIKITNSNKNIIEGDSIKLESSGAVGTVSWNLSNGAPASLRQNNGEWYLDINEVGIDTEFDVTVTDTPSGGTTKTDTVKFTAVALTISGKNPLTVNETNQQYQSNKQGVKWSVDNQNGANASIDQNSGVLNAGGSTGKVIVKAENNGCFASYEVNINAQQQEQNLTLQINNSNQATININGTASLSPNPSDNVTYSYSPNQNEYQDGLNISGNTVTGLKPGTYTLTAYRGDKTATVQIIVSAMDINASKTEIEVDEEITWTINNQPQNSQIRWESSDNTIASVDNSGKITGVKAGQNVTITAIASFNGKEVRASKQITVVDNNSSGGGSTESQYKRVTITNAGTCSSGNKLEFQLREYLPQGAILKKVYVKVSPTGNSNVGTSVGLMVKDANNDTINIWDQKDPWVDIPVGGHVFEYDDPNHVATSEHCFKFGVWGGGPVKIDELIFEYELNQSIVADKADIMVGDEVQFTPENIDETITWSVTDSDGNPTGKATIDSTTGKFTAIEEGTVIVVATFGDNQTVTKTVTINPFVFGFEGSKSFKVHENGTITIGFNTTKPVEVTLAENEFAKLEKVDGVYKITGLKETAKEISFKASCSGSEITGTIEVLPELEITSGDLVYSGDKLTLTANDINGVSWEIISGGEYAELDGDRLKGKEFGTVVVKATDTTDGSTATKSITVKLKPADPGFSYSDIGTTFEPVVIDGQYIIEITKADNWFKEIKDLPIKSDRGYDYMYYIVECDENGRLLGKDIFEIQGDGATFVPTEYQNGMILVSDLLAPVKVSVKNSLASITEDFTLPSTGGSGARTYYYFGGALMLLGIAGFTGLKRRERKRRKE